MPSPRLFVGLISGTSADGVDCVLARETDGEWSTIDIRHHPFSETTAKRLLAALNAPGKVTLPEQGALHTLLGIEFANAVRSLLDQVAITHSDVSAIGSHGQTLYHAPDASQPFSVQLGCGATIAARTGITTVNDFRAADLAVGGQGAPLAPLLHREWFAAAGVTRGVLNLGGIANLTVLDGDQLSLGFDTGPANTLMDAWARCTGLGDCDRDGAIAAAGETDERLLDVMLADTYFSEAPPKSTGREYFDAHWLLRHLAIADDDINSVTATYRANVMSTLCDLSVTTIADAIAHAENPIGELIVCGGGVHNVELMRRLKTRLEPVECHSTAAFGHDPDYIEASLFAWLAAAALDGRAQSLIHVTGATTPVTLGAIHRAPGAH